MPQTPSIDISGNSGCSVRLVRQSQRIAVEKSSQQPSYIPRLKTQIKKQQAFNNRIDDSRICIPKLYEEIEDGAYYSALMEFLPYLNFIDFLSSCSAPALFQSIEIINNFICQNTGKASITINRPALAKLDEIEHKVTDSQPKTQIFQCSSMKLKRYFEHKEITLRAGPCHGDFTLSNLVFSATGDCVGLFDFLDSYIDSPVIDLLKLRQDSQLHWSFLKARKTSSHIRIYQGLKKLDLFAQRKLSKLGVSEDAYRALQAVNLLRILPYANEPETLNFIQSSLKNMEI
ncbi:phosphotransferase [Marinobacter adhaerens]|uniref:Phosphotransferase n=1 Tax=Marinobacter adhaerens TaxID=1033846 RepID=A0A851I3R3_9GAMM|nr:phosphotransferase [Marinobacter adhaerens]NWN92708.1 phosphotransferase [Marinobacter adhaerens]